MSKHHQKYQRDRSRDKHGYRGRSESPQDSSQKKKKNSHHRNSQQVAPKPISRRIKFNDVPDIKVFRKQDEPNTKGLTQADLQQYLKKLQAQKGSEGINNNNQEKMKHFDALLQKKQIKEQKQREKIFHQKLLLVKQQIGFYSPALLKITSTGNIGENSLQKVELTNRLNDVLACFYVQESQIPNQPTFWLQNKSAPTPPKIINFDKSRMDNKEQSNNAKRKEKKQAKPMKGILKNMPEQRKRDRSQSVPLKIDPQLIYLLKQMQINKSAYPKQRAQTLLKPFKQSGQLDYLKNNPNILNQLMKTSNSASVERSYPTNNMPVATHTQNEPYRQRYSASPIPEKPIINYEVSNPIGIQQINKPYDYPQPGYTPYVTPSPYGSGNYYQGYQNQMHQQVVQQNTNMNPVYPAQNSQIGTNYNPQMQQNYQINSYQAQQINAPGFTKNYKTVACKYFHSPQGCVKAQGCTFIHEQKYAGQPTPTMLKSNRGMVMTNYNPGVHDNLQMSQMSQMPQIANNFYQSHPDYQGRN